MLRWEQNVCRKNRKRGLACRRYATKLSTYIAITFKIKSIFCVVLDTQNDETRGLQALCDAFPWSQGKEVDRVKTHGRF
jgi:hypothetical protein